MAETSLPPAWAVDRAIEEIRREDTRCWFSAKAVLADPKTPAHQKIIAFARYICIYEVAPEPPALMQARKLLADEYTSRSMSENARQAREGLQDDCAFMDVIVRLIEQGAEDENGNAP